VIVKIYILITQTTYFTQY